MPAYLIKSIATDLKISFILYTRWESMLSSFFLEHADVVADALLLVLRYAFGNPCDVPDFL